MTDEITYLENIRSSLLTLPSLEKKLIVNDDRQGSRSPGWKTANKHMHELFEMRMLFGAYRGRVNYSDIENICLTPPQILHDGLNECDLQQYINIFSYITQKHIQCRITVFRNV